MAEVYSGNYISIMTHGWWSATGVVTDTITTNLETIKTVYIQTLNSNIKTGDVISHEEAPNKYYETIGILPNSGIQKEFKSTLTYDINTEWYFVENPYPRLRSNGNALSLYDFHILMQKTLKILDEKIAYLPSYPEYLLTDEPESNISDSAQSPKKIITYNTIKSEPGSLSGKPFGDPKEIKKRVREQLFLDPLFRKDIDDPADKLKYYKSEGQWFDNLVQFDLWTKTSHEAEGFIEWFEDILDTYRGMFKELGMQEMVYYRRVRDDTLLRWKNKFNVRSLIYYFRTEKLKVTEIKPIKRINITGKLHCARFYPNDKLVQSEEKILNKWLKSGGK